jgi:hypothetical protein
MDRKGLTMSSFPPNPNLPPEIQNAQSQNYPQPNYGQPVSYAQPLDYSQSLPPGLKLHDIAFRQRAIMLCILAEILCMVLSIASPIHAIGLIALLGFYAAAITASVFVFMLAIGIYNTALGIVMGILTLVPLLGLIILLVVNQKATSILRRHGLKVGLLGANPNQIPPGA